MNNKVAFFRIRLGLSQEQFAHSVGISRPYLSEIETGKANNVGWPIILRISQKIGRPVDEIFFDAIVNHEEQDGPVTRRQGCEKHSDASDGTT